MATKMRMALLNSNTAINLDQVRFATISHPKAMNGVEVSIKMTTGSSNLKIECGTIEEAQSLIQKLICMCNGSRYGTKKVTKKVTKKQ